MNEKNINKNVEKTCYYLSTMMFMSELSKELESIKCEFEAMRSKRRPRN